MKSTKLPESDTVNAVKQLEAGMSHIVIESVESVDTAGFVELLGGFLRVALDSEALKQLSRALVSGEIEFYIARIDGVPVGLCSLTYGFSTYRTARFALTDDLFVAPDARGHNVAGSLIEHVCMRAQSEDCGSIILGCDDELEAMYKRLGFKQIGTMMARDLGTG